MAVRENATDRMVPMAFRHLESTQLTLRAIQKRKGHGDLSETIREAVDQYIERNQSMPKAA